VSGPDPHTPRSAVGFQSVGIAPPTRVWRQILVRCLLWQAGEGKTADGQSFRIIVAREAGLDGFWIHRALQNEGIESDVVDAASIATSRRRRRTKTDRIDSETLVRVLLAYKRGEPQVCAMVKAPTPGEEDRRHLCRERKALTAERVRHVNRIKAFLFSQGGSGYQPLRRDRCQRLEVQISEFPTGDFGPSCSSRSTRRRAN
jgi:transposase